MPATSQQVDYKTVGALTKDKMGKKVADATGRGRLMAALKKRFAMNPGGSANSASCGA
jgi:hypothetical protein